MNIRIMTPTAVHVNPRIRGFGKWDSLGVSETKAGVLSKEAVKLFPRCNSCFLNR